MLHPSEQFFLFEECRLVIFCLDLKKMSISEKGTKAKLIVSLENIEFARRWGLSMRGQSFPTDMFVNFLSFFCKQILIVKNLSKN